MNISDRIIAATREKTAVYTGAQDNVVLEVLSTAPISAYDLGNQAWRVAEGHRDWWKSGRVYERAAALFSKEVGREIPVEHLRAFMEAMVELTAVGRTIMELNEKYSQGA